MAAFALARDGHEHDDHVLHGRRHSVLEDVLQDLAAMAQPEVVQEHAHERAMARIADGLVVEAAHLAFKGLAQGAEAAGGVEGLVARAVEGELLELLHRRHFAQLAFDDRLAALDIFVDDAVGAPGQIVARARSTDIAAARRPAGARCRACRTGSRYRAPTMEMKPGRETALRDEGASLRRRASSLTMRVVATSSVRSK